ncbi:MAG: M28 family peptidase [Anaerolineae bacterium]|nr:M28 family peptidase [Phycisphaerae bacterium]
MTAAPQRAESLQLLADPFVVVDSKKTVTYLASDELEGRGVGTKGLDLAADYIARRYEALGLRKLPGQKDYFQRFDFTTSITIADETALALDGQSKTLRQQFAPIGFSAEGAFDAPIVFVGYGVSQPDDSTKYDDYAGVDVKGKVVLAMRYEPRDEKGKSRFSGEEQWSSAASITSKAAEAEKHGAIALLLVSPPNDLGGKIGPATAPSTQPASAPTEKDTDRLMDFGRSSMGGRGSIPVIHIKRAEAEALLAQAKSQSLAELQAKIDATSETASFELPNSKATGKVVLKRNVAEVKNVMAMLPGHGPNADEYVVVGAHYDHLGRGMLGSMIPGSREIHHGADDNASGTGAVLQLATNLVRGGRLDRSIIFITFTAEEEGLIGSQHFVDNPPVPLNKIAAMLNIDMVGRIQNELLYVGGSGTAPAFDAMVKAGDEASPLVVKDVGPMVGRGGMGPSDHQSFALKKIPVLFFFSGVHPDYHRPTDTADKINYDGMAEAISLGQYLVKSMAKMPQQEYVAKFDKESTRSHGGPTLGVIPDYASGESTTGVRINGTRPESPAAKAGLKQGDVIVELGVMKVGSIYDLTDALGKLQAGQRVKVVVKRGDERVELEAVMGAPRG